MSAPKFLTEILSYQTRIFITANTLLAQEIKNQLEDNPKIKVVDSENADMFFHLVGFEKPSLADTVYHTSTLHQYLDRALETHAKFVLIIPKQKSALVDVAISLVHQFAKNFGLTYKILEASSAETILQALFKNYHKPEPIPVPTIVEPVPVLVSHNYQYLKFVFAAVGLWVFTWLVLGLQNWLLAYNVRCAYADWSVACARRAKALTSAIQIEMPWVIGAKQVIQLQGYPLPQTFVILQRLVEGVELAQKLPQFLQTPTTFTEYLSQAQADLNEFSSLSTAPPSWLVGLLKELQDLKSLANKIKYVLPDLTPLISADRKSNYLILLQDNTELRSTGGFVGQIGLVTVDHAKITNVEWFDTFASDGQLRGQVPPPAQLKQILGENSWYLRDINWDVDLPSFAPRAAWFVEKELGRSVDWVVAVNLSTVNKLLEILGPVNGVDHHNLVTQYLTQVKPDVSPSFIVTLMQELTARPSMLSGAQNESLLRYLISALETRQIFITPVVAGQAPRLATLGWDGHLAPDLACRTQEVCLTNWLYAVDTNIGINKVNPYVDRKIAVSQNFALGKISSTYKLVYTNTSPKIAWPLGSYKNFLRVYLPQNQKIDRIVFDQKELAKNQYTLTPVHGLLEVGLKTEILAGKSRVIEIEAHQDLPNVPRFHYQLDIPNQPGAFLDTLTFSMTYPKTWFAVGYGKPAVATSGRLEYNAPLVSPQKFDVDFAIK